MFRPAETRWFEMLCPREESVRTLVELARTGAVQLELRPRCGGGCPLVDVDAGLVEYRRLLPRYRRYWQRGHLRRGPLVEGPVAVLARALERIAAWRREADPLIDDLQAAEDELTRLKWLEQIIGRIQGSPLDFSLITGSGPLLGTFCAILPAEAPLDLPAWALARSVPWEDERCFMILGPADRLGEAKSRVQALKGRIVERPDWLRGGAAEALSRIGARRRFLATRRVYLEAELDSLFEDHQLNSTLGDVAWLDWFSEQVGALELAGEHLAWITGWSDDLDGARLEAALDRAQTRALLRFAPPPAELHPPRVLHNPAWLEPFEPFAKALGVPGDDEADPTPVLAAVVPLLFGYMFGDLGQGLLLVLLGLWLAPRFALARLLVACGASAAVFGLLFGSLFGIEGIIPALWLHPLSDPLLVLAVPLVFAVGLLSLGQLLAGLGALWRGRLREWLLVDAGFLVLYLGLVALIALPDSAAGWLAPLGLVWYLAGAFLVAHRLLGPVAALGRLVEHGLQLLTNTLSFARVGAFALAHAALSAAIVTMAAAAPGWAAPLILVLGNLVVILLEGLVVSIQTTRLVLFEFFNRFLHGTGRVFRPLAPPSGLLAGPPAPSAPPSHPPAARPAPSVAPVVSGEVA